MAKAVKAYIEWEYAGGARAICPASDEELAIYLRAKGFKVEEDLHAYPELEASTESGEHKGHNHALDTLVYTRASCGVLSGHEYGDDSLCIRCGHHRLDLQPVGEDTCSGASVQLGDEVEG